MELRVRDLQDIIDQLPHPNERVAPWIKITPRIKEEEIAYRREVEAVPKCETLPIFVFEKRWFKVGGHRWVEWVLVQAPDSDKGEKHAI